MRHKRTTYPTIPNRKRSSYARPTPRCTYNATGTFCSHACDDCNERLTVRAMSHAERRNREIARSMSARPRIAS